MILMSKIVISGTASPVAGSDPLQLAAKSDHPEQPAEQICCQSRFKCDDLHSLLRNPTRNPIS